MITDELETRRAGPAEHDEAADLLAEAFENYPWTRWTVDSRRHVDRVRALQRLALEHFAGPFGEVWVTAGAARLLCVAVWMDSAVEVPAAVQQATAPEVARLEGRRHAASVLASAQLSDWRPPGRHLYLGAVGTRPADQRRGLARRTLLPQLGRADREQIPVYLETSSQANVRFYTALGFDVVRHELVAGGGPDVWAMLRQPGAAGPR